MMRIAVTADLHFEVARSAEPARAMAAELCGSPADALIIAGDTFAFETEGLTAALRHFDGFPGAKFLVAGNHDLWTRTGDSELIYQTLGQAAAAAGFHFLDDAPAVLGGVGLVGNIGWWDLSYRRAELGVPLRFYEAKVAPGAAGMFEQHRRLLDPAEGEPPTERAIAIRARWMDGVRVRRRQTDAEFLQMCLDRLDRHLTEIAPQVDVIVAAVHHLPFAELVPLYGDDRYDFAAAYLGSPRIGEVLLAHPKVRLAFCGHSHRPGRVQHGGLTCLNVGSGYTFKQKIEVAVGPDGWEMVGDPWPRTPPELETAETPLLPTPE